jgi:hypothetical protein
MERVFLFGREETPVRPAPLGHLPGRELRRAIDEAYIRSFDADTVRFRDKDFADGSKTELAKLRESPLVDRQVVETDGFLSGSIFTTLQEPSRFFEAGWVGYSPRPNSCTLDGLLLRVSDWRVSPPRVEYVRSAYFDDRSLFFPR